MAYAKAAARVIDNGSGMCKDEFAEVVATRAVFPLKSPIEQGIVTNVIEVVKHGKPVPKVKAEATAAMKFDDSSDDDRTDAKRAKKQSISAAKRIAILEAANEVQRGAGRHGIGETCPLVKQMGARRSSFVMCEGCDRAMKAKFDPFCCGACRNLTAFWEGGSLDQEANRLPPSVQKRHGPQCSEGELYVKTWRAQGRPSR